MMLRTLSIRTGLLSLLAVMTLLLLLVSGIGIYALTPKLHPRCNVSITCKATK
ncbi:Uncharacterised protein [Kluyvera cryocrescens]|uniref:Uncharacterized protein n=1 Tax=Kluyvera cryocrescens TaxID=580 RepID=A0A485BFL5_KLUCR|nr:Uncharacterised protein [Kluyvera cryocrescens]